MGQDCGYCKAPKLKTCHHLQDADININCGILLIFLRTQGWEYRPNIAVLLNFDIVYKIELMPVIFNIS